MATLGLVTYNTVVDAEKLRVQAGPMTKRFKFPLLIGFRFCQRVQAGPAQATFEQKRQLIEPLIDRVVVTNEDVEIRYVVPTTLSSEHVRFCHLYSDHFNVHAFLITPTGFILVRQIGDQVDWLVPRRPPPSNDLNGTTGCSGEPHLLPHLFAAWMGKSGQSMLITVVDGRQQV